MSEIKNPIRESFEKEMKEVYLVDETFVRFYREEFDNWLSTFDGYELVKKEEKKPEIDWGEVKKHATQMPIVFGIQEYHRQLMQFLTKKNGGEDD